MLNFWGVKKVIRKLSIQDVKTAVQNFPTASQDHEFGERSFTNITPRVFAVRILGKFLKNIFLFIQESLEVAKVSC